MGTAAVAAIVVKEKRIVATFRQAGAVAPQSAVAPAGIGVAERLAFRKLRQHAVLREARPGVFYLDEPSWQALRSLRHRTVLILLCIVLLTAFGVWSVMRLAGAA
jgi:hypothetical protein